MNPAVGEYELVNVNSITNQRKKVPISQAVRDIKFEAQTVTPGVGTYSFKNNFNQESKKKKTQFESVFGSGTMRFQDIK
jgi:hypothetical protein